MTPGGRIPQNTRVTRGGRASILKMFRADVALTLRRWPKHVTVPATGTVGSIGITVTNDAPDGAGITLR